MCHFTARFAAVCFLSLFLFFVFCFCFCFFRPASMLIFFKKGTVATTVCSPADVLKSRIMNASGPGSSVSYCPFPPKKKKTFSIITSCSQRSLSSVNRWKPKARCSCSKAGYPHGRVSNLLLSLSSWRSSSWRMEWIGRDQKGLRSYKKDNEWVEHTHTSRDDSVD